MNITTLLSTLAIMLAKYRPEQLNPSMKPPDSAGCASCKKVKYDFIIVGAGSAGSVLANRLSADPDWKVLLIEAGGDENYVSDTPALSSLLFGTKYDWNYTTVKQEKSCYSSGGICRYTAGHSMGGTSTINGMDYVRGNPQDYDHWEALGNPGWSYQDVLPYFLKGENMTIPELKYSPYHSAKGELSVGYSPYHVEISDDFVLAMKEGGYPEVDYNGRIQIGVSRAQFTVRGPNRCSTSKAYLDPIRENKNLIIFKNTQVIKILINPVTKRAEGVRYLMNGKEYNTYCSKEVIISAGVMNTPKLLMLSGIGPKAHLEELGIPVIADLPVGDNFIDHSGLSLNFNVNKAALNCCTGFTEGSILEYVRDQSGVLTSPSQQVIAFLNSENQTSSVPDLTVIMGVINQQFTGNSSPRIFVYVGNIYPKSFGKIRLQSNNYRDQPLIDPNYFAQESDMNAIRYAIRQVLRYTSSPIMQKYSLQWSNYDRNVCKGFTDIYSTESLNCFIEHTAGANYHGVGTARMGSRFDKSTVVDAKLRVHGVGNLRVVDASVMPRITRGNPNAPTIMIAEKAADLIRLNYVSKLTKTK